MNCPSTADERLANLSGSWEESDKLSVDLSNTTFCLTECAQHFLRFPGISGILQGFLQDLDLICKCSTWRHDFEIQGTSHKAPILSVSLHCRGNWLQHGHAKSTKSTEKLRLHPVQCPFLCSFLFTSVHCSLSISVDL